MAKKTGNYAVETMDDIGSPKVSMWKLETQEEAGGREPVWVECPNLPVGMIKPLRERGFRELPPDPPEVAEIPETLGTLEAPLYVSDKPPKKTRGKSHKEK